MHKTILTAGIALLLAGIAVPGAAYHIAGSAVPIHACTQATLDGNTLTTHHWCIGATFLCEDETAPKVGDGGLCFMSAGHGGDSAANPLETDCESKFDIGSEPDGHVDEAGRSDGWGYDHLSFQGEQPNTVGCAGQLRPDFETWYLFNMTGYDGDGAMPLEDVIWTAQAGPAQCDADVHNTPGNARHEELVVDELFLFWTDNGHLAGYPDPTHQNAINPATYGTYDVDFGEPQSGPGCDSTLPGAPVYIV